LTHRDEKSPGGNGTGGDGKVAERDEEPVEESEKV
jgi:hypothetical protein